MNERWRSGRFVMRFPSVSSRRGALGSFFAFTFAVMVVTILVWSPRIPTNIQQDLGEVEKKEISLTYPMVSPQTEFETQSSSHILHQVGQSDFKRLINLTNFEFSINHFPCNKSSTLGETTSPIILLIFVHSDPVNFEKRQVIRDTWGSWAYIQQTDITINLIFLLGEVLNPTLQKHIELENKITNDIVQGQFIDSYRNLTYKHVMGLKWCTHFCPQASYVLKTDDDIFVNTPALVHFLTEPRFNSSIKPKATRFILCSCIDNAHVKRSYRSKWHVTRNEYSNNVYPSYCMGCAILYSFDVVTKLYEKAQLSPYFWVDDVHITGILRNQLNLTLTHIDNLMLKSNQVDEIISNPRGESSWFTFWKIESLAWGKGKDQFLFSTELGLNAIRKLWKIVNAYGSN